MKAGFGRDPEYEQKHQKWIAGGKTEREPEKFHFVKGFHRGIELLGQHVFDSPEVSAKAADLGLIVVEGPNDVIRLDTLGVPAVALCSNAIRREQAAKAAQFVRRAADGIVTVFLDCDPEGEAGMKQALGYLTQLLPVRLAWASNMYGGKFKGRQPESLKEGIPGVEWLGDPRIGFCEAWLGRYTSAEVEQEAARTYRPGRSAMDAPSTRLSLVGLRPRIPARRDMSPGSNNSSAQTQGSECPNQHSRHPWNA